MIETGDPLADAKLAEYDEAMQRAIAAALAGRYTRKQLADLLARISYNYVRLMFLLGGGDMTRKDAQKWLKEQDAIHKNSARKLARDVFKGRYRAESD